jgi:hypothetical protein
MEYRLYFVNVVTGELFIKEYPTYDKHEINSVDFACFESMDNGTEWKMIGKTEYELYSKIAQFAEENYFR